MGGYKNTVQIWPTAASTRMVAQASLGPVGALSFIVLTDGSSRHPKKTYVETN